MATPDRIVVINDASTARGGATGLAILSVKLLRARGHAVTYICGDDSSHSVLVDMGVEVISSGQKQLVKEGKLTAFRRGIFNARAMTMVADWVDRNDTPGTVYHVHGWSKILSPSIFRALKRVAHRTVIHAHDFFLVCPNGAFMDYRRERACNRVPLSGGCLATNCDKRSYLQKLWRVTRSGVLRSLLDGTPWASFIAIHPNMEALLARGGLPQQQLVTVRNPAEALSEVRIRAEDNAKMVFIGRVEDEKGIREAIAAAKSASVAMKVIGEGPLRERLEVEFPEIEFLGWRTREEISQLISDARFLVLPSRYPEPFGLVVAEASQSGLPILLSKTAFLSGEIVREHIGLSCDVSDAGDFARAVGRLRDMSTEEMRSMSERAFANQSGLSNRPETWVSALLGLYGAALDKGGVTPMCTLVSGSDHGVAR